MTMTYEEALGIPNDKHQPEEKTVVINASLTKPSPQTTQLTPSPPSEKIDILIDLLKERERLKTIREDINTGKRKLSKNLSTDLFITQMVISANKIALEALKETNIALTQNNITQVNHVVKFVKPTRSPVANDADD